VADDQGSSAISPPRVIALGAELLQQGVVIPSFAQFAMTGEDNLRIFTVGSIANIVVNINGRFLDAATRKTIPFNFLVPVSSDRTVTVLNFALGTGYLLNMTAFATGMGSPQIGQCYVQVSIIRGLANAFFVLGTLIAGYVTVLQALGWPGSPIRNSIDADPPPRQISISLPLAGNDWLQAVPTGARWEVVTFFGALVTDANPGNRLPVFTIKIPPGAVAAAMTATIAQAPSTTFNYALAQNLPLLSSFTQAIMVPMPQRLFLPAGSTIASITSLISGGDLWESLTLTVREWLEVN